MSMSASSPRCLPLTTEVPSTEPILFYRCLLRGKQVVPYEGHNAYKLAIADTEPLALMDDVAPLPIGDEDGILLALPELPADLAPAAPLPPTIAPDPTPVLLHDGRRGRNHVRSRRRWRARTHR